VKENERRIDVTACCCSCEGDGEGVSEEKRTRRESSGPSRSSVRGRASGQESKEGSTPSSLLNRGSTEKANTETPAQRDAHLQFPITKETLESLSQ
jgi:hypothetical protein